MEQLSPAFILSAASTVITALGFFFGLRFKLDATGAKVDAVHKRLDDYEDKHQTLDKLVAVHESLIKDLRDFRHNQVNAVGAFKMAKELLQEEREDRGQR